MNQEFGISDDHRTAVSGTKSYLYKRPSNYKICKLPLCKKCTKHSKIQSA